MNLTLKQYKAIDIAILTGILVLGTFLATKATEWFPMELYALSPVVALVCIVMMRWGGWAAIDVVAGGLTYCVALGADWQQYVVCCVGGLGGMAGLILFKTLGKEKIRASFKLSELFMLTVYVGSAFGKGIVSLLLGAPLSTLVMFFWTDLISLLFAAVAIFVARRVDGLFEDQKSYLIRTESERAKARLGGDDRLM